MDFLSVVSVAVKRVPVSPSKLEPPKVMLVIVASMVYMSL